MENVTKELQKFAEAMSARYIRTDETGEHNALSVGTDEKGFLLIQETLRSGEVFFVEDGMDPHAKTIARISGVDNMIAFGIGFFLA